MNRLPVLDRTYDFVKWLVPAVAQFPRQQRFLLGERIEGAALELLDLLVEARVSPETRPQVLRQAVVRVDRLCCLLRLSHELTLLSPRRYEHGSRVLDEIGRQVGGWMKAGAQRREPPVASAAVGA